MNSNNNLYEEIISLKNLIFAWKKARKGKTKLNYVLDFEANLAYNLKILHDELKNLKYFPLPLKTFILRDPKTRKISKSFFRDRIVHHAIIKVIEPLFDKSFICDSCANRSGKGTLYALRRFEKFQIKTTHNFSKEAFCLKADIKHYFQEIDRNILFSIFEKKIRCNKTLYIIKSILWNFEGIKGIPLGNLTSQFFANVYLNELDQFVKHKLKVKYYIRYVDDFVILHSSKKQLDLWKEEIIRFLGEILKLELHSDKSRIISLSNGVNFVGFRVFYFFKIPRKRNLKNMKRKIILYNNRELFSDKFFESFEGWNAYVKWSNSYNLRINLIGEVG